MTRTFYLEPIWCAHTGNVRMMRCCGVRTRKMCVCVCVPSDNSVCILISDPGGCFVSNELREWAGIRDIGLLTVPGEFHGLTADLENLIRVINRLVRKLPDDPPELTLASCVSLACSSHNNGFNTGGYSHGPWAFGADNEGHGFTTTMPLRLRLSGYQR